MNNNIKISIIVPVFNEQGNLILLDKRISDVMGQVNLSYELIFIDDGSTDNSAKELKKISETNNNVRVITLQRNYGQTQAIAAGIDHARAQLIVTMDADLQNDPRDIPKLLDKIEEGYDVVSGWRFKRKDSFWKKRVPSYWANLISAKLTGIKLHDLGCTLKVYKLSILKDIEFYGEIHRFLPLCAAIEGAKIAEIKVRHHERKYGRSKYGISRFFKAVLDMLTILFAWKFMTKPIHIFGSIGIASISLSSLIGLFIVLRKVLWQGQWVSPLLFLFVVFFIAGIQFVLMGILAELIIRLYYGMRDQIRYKIKTKHSKKD